MDRKRWWLAVLLLAAAYWAVLAWTAPAMGYTRDEGYYFKAAEQYGAWWDTLFSKRFLTAFSDEEIRLRFGYNTEHPALVKLLMGISYRVLNQWTGLAGPSQAFRATGFGFAALSLVATFLLGRALVSAPVGLIAALFVATLPRYFYDAHLACFDVPIAAMWTLSLWAFWRALEAPRATGLRAALFAGLVFGLALATKLNALFLPPLFVLLWLYREKVWRSLSLVAGPSGGLDLELPSIPLVLVSCAVIGPLVFIAHWPYLWHDTVARISGYIGFHLHHEHYPISYFHEVLIRPPFPWHFAWVMSALTVPSPMLALGALGILLALRRALFGGSSADLLLLGGALLPILLITMPGTPIFGGVKHWYNGMPCLAILAARSLHDGAVAIGSRLEPVAGRALILALVVLSALPGALGIAASHPNGIGFYNELAGGITGGAELGMQRSFWGGVNRPLMEKISSLKGARVFFDHMNYDAYLMYRRENLLGQTVGFANTGAEAQAATLFEHREGYPVNEEGLFSSIGTRPIGGVYTDNVTFVQLYARPELQP